MMLPKACTTVTPLTKTLALALLVVFPFAGFYLGIIYSKITNIPKLVEPPINLESFGQWNLASEVTKGFGFVGKENPNLLIYNIESGKLFDTGMQIVGGAESLGKGSYKPLTSPNLLYTAVLDNNSKLLIVSHTNLKAYPVETDQKVDFITTWSGDGKKLIYHTSSENLSDLLQYSEYTSNKYVFPPSNAYNGFWLYDLESGKKQELYPLQNVLGVDTYKTILASEWLDLQPYIFNILDFSADLSQIDWKKFGSDEDHKKITRQYNICNNCPLWAYVRTDYGRTQPLDYLVVARFPEEEGKQVSTNWFPGINWPLLSPNGKLIAYQMYYADGEFTKIDVVDDKTSIRATVYWAGQSTPKMWLDDKRLVIRLLESEANDLQYVVWNTDTGQLANIYESIAVPAFSSN